MKKLPMSLVVLLPLLGCLSCSPDSHETWFPRAEDGKVNVLLGETPQAGAVLCEYKGFYGGIVNRDAKSHVMGGLDEDNSPQLSLLGHDASISFDFAGAANDVPTLVLARAAGMPRVYLKAEENGGGELLLLGGPSDPKVTSQARLGFRQADPYLSLKSGEGRGQVFAAVHEDGTPRFELRDGKGRPRVVIGLAPDGAGFLRFLDEHGKPTSPAP